MGDRAVMMDSYYRDLDLDINLIETILLVQDDLGKERTNKLISLLNKKMKKRYSRETKTKDTKKSLVKYKTINFMDRRMKNDKY